MGNYITASLPTLTAITTPGDIGNKLNAAKEQTIENMQYTAKALGSGVALGGGTYLALKNQTVCDTFAKGLDKAAGATAKAAVKIAPNAKKVIEKLLYAFKNLPGYGKVAGAAATLAVIVGNHLSAAHRYKQGKIDQKHETIAKMREKAEKTI